MPHEDHRTSLTHTRNAATTALTMRVTDTHCTIPALDTRRGLRDRYTCYMDPVDNQSRVVRLSSSVDDSKAGFRRWGKACQIAEAALEEASEASEWYQQEPSTPNQDLIEYHMPELLTDAAQGSKGASSVFSHSHEARESGDSRAVSVADRASPESRQLSGQASESGGFNGAASEGGDRSPAAPTTRDASLEAAQLSAVIPMTAEDLEQPAADATSTSEETQDTSASAAVPDVADASAAAEPVDEEVVPVFMPQAQQQMFLAIDTPQEAALSPTATEDQTARSAAPAAPAAQAERSPMARSLESNASPPRRHAPPPKKEKGGCCA